MQQCEIENNPGPLTSSRRNFCHWNLNGIVAHGFVQVPLIEAFIIANNIGIICLSRSMSSSSWWFNANWSDENSKVFGDIDSFTTTAGYTQMIGQSTYIMNDKLRFTTNSKLLCDVGVDQNIYKKCHLDVIYRSVNLKIPLPPIYYKEI